MNDNEKHGRFAVSLGTAWNKGLTNEMGQAPAKRYNEYLRDLVVAGRAKPSLPVSTVEAGRQERDEQKLAR